MSDSAKQWCSQQGDLIGLALPDLHVAEKLQIDPQLVEAMETACGSKFWESRSSWFKKPLACLQSPFQNTLWIDLDCQINGSVGPIFDFQTVAMAKEPSGVYNAGVIAFTHGEPLIKDWAKGCHNENHRLRGDQDVLNNLIQQQQAAIVELPPIYNWSRLFEQHAGAIILHWHGPHGKTVIAHQIAKANLQSLGFIN